ncbi:hypothetical protein BFP77_01905 [Maribacter sp. 4U21]|uniref:hypothetical protein n=1 Tax=Maribacter sp. 4U21 TaxID=1889779 RepID=UPI000C153A04|nr:hypothetical protein [Maribacter sp. 4U21]PIB31347.1 hypothetical protein BFP77_01905 [Maribacter sp. 4U21]
MTNKELFDNIHLFMPDGVEFIHDILENIGHISFRTEEVKRDGLEIIRKLLELNLIEVFHWGEHHKIIYNLDFTLEQTVKYVDNIWFIGADVSDFYGMVMFKYKDWYLQALEKEGLTHTTYWKVFVQEKIGDLEKWIEKNRPSTI